MSRGVNCSNPNEVLAIYPCLRCESPIEMFAILTGILGMAQGVTDLNVMIESAKKWRNINDIDLLRAMISTLPESFFDGQDPTNMNFSALESTGTQQIKAIFVVLWCQFWEAYSGAPLFCENLSGEGPPT